MSDDTIEEAVGVADPMVLRGLLYQLSGDEELRNMKVKTVMRGFKEVAVPASEEDVAMVRQKAAEFLKSHRDAGAPDIDPGPAERLRLSLSLVVGKDLPPEDVGLYVEELALNPWARALAWDRPPPRERLECFSVTIIGAGMGGLNAAVHLKRAGIPYTLIEKNASVGGTWYENRYPGVRVDTLSRAYTHLYGVNFGYPNPFCAGSENERYCNWVADQFELRDDIVFDTEVRSLTWDEDASMWEIAASGPNGERLIRSTSVMTAVGFLNRPNIPEIKGMAEFQGPSWHTAHWPEDVDLVGKRVAVIGTGCTGYQLIPELALTAEHVTVFQRTPQWLFPVPGYCSPFPVQMSWLDRNFPFHANFMRFFASFGVWAFSLLSEIDPDFDDPYSCSAANKRARDACIAFLHSKLRDPDLVAKMTPPHPPFSARPVNADPEHSVLDAIMRSNVTLVTEGIGKVNAMGIEARHGIQHDADVVVYATGFRATEYLFPMKITGRSGRTVEELWAEDGARAYLGCMLPDFPNLWMIYGPNTNAGLSASSLTELASLYALQCMQRLILDGKRTIEVTAEAYWHYNRLVDERNLRKVWSDQRAHNYYWTKHGRSAVMCPFDPPEMWRFLRHPKFEELELR